MKIIKRITALVMAVALSLPALLSPLCTNIAFAAGDINLSVGGEVGYAGYSTNRMTANGNFAYCVQPSKDTPASGNYTRHDDVANYMANPGDTAAAEYLRRIAYRCYGSPGFDPSYFPSTWYDGSGMDDEKYIALSHIILADAATYEGGKAVYGCTKDFKNWAYQNVLGFNNKGEIINENAPRVKLAGVDAPQTFQIFILDTGSTQKIMGFEYHPEGSLNLVKTSANASLTDGNSCYSLAGAVYGVYSDSGCTTQVGTLTTDGAGNSNTISLTVGTYFVKEIIAPKGYAKDNSIHSINVESEKTSTVRVSDMPTNDPIAITLSKIDQHTGEATQGGASLEGAEFTVKYYDGYYNAGNLPENATRTWVIKTKERTSGSRKTYMAVLDNSYKVAGDSFYTAGSTICVPLGTISIEETKAPTGYKLEGAYLQAYGSSTKIIGKYVAQVTQTGDIAYLKGGNEYTISDSVERGGIAVRKYDNETSTYTPQGGATLQGAKIDIISNNDQPVMVNGKTYSKGQTVKTLTTDANGYAATQKDELPYGNYIVKETSAPTGYQLSGKTQINTVVHSNNTLVNLTSSGNGIRDNVIRGGVKVTKLDNETGKNAAQGGATLQGAKIEIIANSSHAVIVNGKSYTKGQVIETLTTDKNGIAQTAANELPYGDYILKEITAPAGYLVSGQTQRSFSIRTNGTVVDMTSGSTGIRDDIIRGDIQLVKFQQSTDEEEDLKKPLQGITFSITSKSTGQVFNITTDKNGYASTKQLNISSRGNLVYDTYVIHETNTPAGLAPVKDWEVTISREGQTLYYIVEDKVNILSPVSLVKVDSETGQTIPLANAEFQLLDENKNVITMTTHYPNTEVHETFKTDASGTFTLPDKLKVGTYYFREVNAPEGYLINDQDVKFEITEAHNWDDPFEVTFSDSPEKGRIEVTKTDELSGDALEGTVFNIVAADDIITPDGTVKAQAGDIVDTVTTGSDGKAVSQELYLGKYKVVETQQTTGHVRPSDGWDVELKYKDQNTEVVTESLSVTNKPTEIRLKKVDENGDPLSGVQFQIWNKAMDNTKIDPEMSFKETYTTDENGEILLQYLECGTYCVKEIRADGYMLDPDIHEFTVDETGRIEGEESYTMTLVNYKSRITTTAKDKMTGLKQSVAKKDTTIVDTVSYENLDVGREYTLQGALMMKDTGDSVMVDGEPVTAEQTFIPEESNGSVDVEFHFDASNLQDQTVVAFEQLYQGDVKAAEHIDLEDENQTISFPKHAIETDAKDEMTGTQQAIAKKDTAIVDTVSYSGLLSGQEYTVKGVLMVKDTGDPVMVDGEPVTAEQTFIPEESKGSVDVEFRFDASNLQDQTVVAFERLYQGEDQLAEHTDLNDSRQAINFPKHTIQTYAKDKATGTKEAIAKKNTTIVDTVSYSGLFVGQEYTLKAILVMKDTGEAVKANGELVTAEQTFIPEESNGSVDVELTFDSSELNNKELVVYERLYQGEDQLAEHTDLNDQNQTVKIKIGGLLAAMKNDMNSGLLSVFTGDNTDLLSYVVILVVSIVLVGAAWIRKRRKERPHETQI